MSWLSALFSLGKKQPQIDYDEFAHYAIKILTENRTLRSEEIRICVQADFALNNKISAYYLPRGDCYRYLDQLVEEGYLKDRKGDQLTEEERAAYPNDTYYHLTAKRFPFPLREPVSGIGDLNFLPA